jgi:hypothetical protein
MDEEDRNMSIERRGIPKGEQTIEAADGAV